MKKRYEELLNLVTQYNHEYYTKDNSSISDKEYDALYDELESIEAKNPEFISLLSPTQRVGGDILDKFEKKTHTTPLYSLEKAQTFERVRKFVQDVQQIIGASCSFSLEQKLDGLAFVARYEKGLLVEVRTRGTGKIGEVITIQTKTIRSLPLSIPFTDTIEVQGEIFMPIDRFNQFNKRLLDAYSEHIASLTEELTPLQLESLQKKYAPLKNPRNGAAGAIRNLNTSITASRPLDAYLYNVPYIEGRTFTTQEELMTFLKIQGFKTNPYLFIETDIDLLIFRLEEMEKIRPTLNFDIDGMVIKVNEIPHRDEIGYTSKFPKWAIAYKFESIEETTTLLSVSFEVGRTGKITPVGHLEPIDFGGTTVTKATLNNMDDIQRKGVKIGAEVFVRRSNDVIPEITGIVPGSLGEDIVAPSICPTCSHTLVEDGAHLYCPNDQICPSQQIGKIIHFGSREAMNIDSFSEKTAELLWENNLLHDVSSLYILKKEQLLDLERFGERSADKLLAAIEESKSRPLEAFLFALGIRHSGKGTAERLLRHYSTIEEIQAATIEEFMLIEDIGEVVAESLYTYFHTPITHQLVERLKDLGVKMVAEKKEEAGSALVGSTFVLTGTMPSGIGRKELEAKIKSHGGKISSSLSKKTTYLVAGDAAGSKLTNAESLGVKILTEEKLYKDFPSIR